MSSHRFRFPLALAAMLLACGATTVSAQAVDPAAPRVYGLSPGQKAAALAATADPLADALPGGAADRQIHGEFGAMVGTGGARGLYGVAAIPLGEDAGAIVSFENSRFGNRRYR